MIPNEFIMVLIPVLSMIHTGTTVFLGPYVVFVSAGLATKMMVYVVPGHIFIWAGVVGMETDSLSYDFVLNLVYSFSSLGIQDIFLGQGY